MRRIDIIVSRTSTRAEIAERVQHHLYDNFAIADGHAHPWAIVVTGEDRDEWTAEAQVEQLWWFGLTGAKVVG